MRKLVQDRAARLAALCLPLLLASVGGASSAAAHARLEAMQPAPDLPAQVAPREVTLRFDSVLEPAFSKLRVLDAAGRRVDAGDAAVAADDLHVLRVSLQGLSAGRYTVQWRAVCRDGHPSQGKFVFAVK